MTSATAPPPPKPPAPATGESAGPAAPTPKYQPRPRGVRRAKDRWFQVVCIAAALLAIVILVVLIAAITFRGAPRLFGSFGEFMTGFHSSQPEEAGLAPAIVGTIWLLIITALTAIPLGVGTAILLEEYKPRNRFLGWLHGFVQLNITNLAGVPSIVYGILGLTVFAQFIFFAGHAGDPFFKVGQRWYHTYEGLGGSFFYVAAADEAEAKSERPVEATMEFLIAPVPGAESASVRVMSAEEVGPIEAGIDRNFSALDGRINRLIRERRENGRGPVAITEEQAAAMSEQVFEGVVMQADVGKLSGIATAQFLAMNGLDGLAVTRARRSLTGELKAAEIAASGAGDIVPAGTKATPIDYRAWYYLQLPFGRGLLAGGLTLMLVVLPVVIVASQEAIRSVPPSMRAGCLALGGTKWQSIRQVVLPGAIPGICTGSILAMSRAIGEAAPLLMLGAVFITFVPGPKPGFGEGTLMDSFSALPLQIFQWTGMPDEGFRDAAAAGIIVLLVVLLSFNALAVLIRQKFTQKN